MLFDYLALYFIFVLLFFNWYINRPIFIFLLTLNSASIFYFEGKEFAFILLHLLAYTFPCVVKRWVLH